ncbi:hypothetical protein AK830_g4797 [Neonectria ditissima]|uniref:Uncharacterized protein n=1 Tax=Neonectria ditissima TaxID=78410 RepID=A0A0P7BML9_9HYPO|nr:hypothetical protein AK830_g4797 [Neonectria ditissima]
MYQRPITASRSGPPLRSAGSFYYDYTEEFSTDPQLGPDSAAPLCPIPQRVGSIHRPMVLREDSNDDLGAGDDRVPVEIQQMDVDKDNTEDNTLNRIRMEASALELPEDMDQPTCASNSAGETIHTSLSPTTSTMSTADPGNIEATLPHIRRVNSRSALLASPENDFKAEELETSSGQVADSPSCSGSSLSASKSEIWQFSKVQVDPHVTDRPTERASQFAPPKLRRMLNPAPPEINFVVDKFHDPAKIHSDIPDDGMAIHIGLIAQHTKPETQCKKPTTYPRSRNRRPQAQRNGTWSNGPQPRVQHRRNPATIGIAATEIPDLATPGPDLDHPVAGENTPILSPNPISPAHQLKLTNSVPQLMKALPPLPHEAHQLVESPFGSVSTEPEVSTRLLFSSPAKSMVPFKCEESSSFLGPKIFSDEDHAEVINVNSGIRSSKFKIRMKTSRSALIAREPSSTPLEVSGETLADYKRPRLKLKISRSLLSPGETTQQGTVIRSPGLKQCSSLSDLDQCPNKSLFAGRCSLEEMQTDKKTYPGLERGDLKAIHEANGPEQSPKPSDQFDILYPPSVMKEEEPATDQILDPMMRNLLYINRATQAQLDPENGFDGFGGGHLKQSGLYDHAFGGLWSGLLTPVDKVEGGVGHHGSFQALFWVYL